MVGLPKPNFKANYTAVVIYCKILAGVGYISQWKRTADKQRALDFFFFFFFFLGPHPPHVEVPRSNRSYSCGLHHSHSNVGSEPCLQPNTTAHGNPRSLTHWARPGSNPHPHGSYSGLLTTDPWRELPALEFWQRLTQYNGRWTVFQQMVLEQFNIHRQNNLPKSHTIYKIHLRMGNRFKR